MIDTEEIKVETIIAPWFNVTGGIRENEAAVLLSLWGEVGGNFLEIGTCTGMTSRLMAVSAPWSKVFTVDVASPEAMHADQRNEFLGRKVGYFCIGLPNVHMFDCGSRNFDPTRKDIRMVFIDGDHQHDAVVRDTEMAIAIAREGHRFVIAWHDYEDEERHDCPWLGVGSAVRKLSARYGMSVAVARGTRIAFWRSWQHR